LLSPNPADEPIVVEQMPGKDIISGHGHVMMMNQVSNSTSCFGHILSGKASHKPYPHHYLE
jgi:hypothetical protein